MKSRLIIALIMISALVIGSISYLFIMSSSEEKDTITASDVPDVYDEQIEENSTTTKSKKISLKINEVSDYKKMTKAEIYELRKKICFSITFCKLKLCSIRGGFRCNCRQIALVWLNIQRMHWNG